MFFNPELSGTKYMSFLEMNEAFGHVPSSFRVASRLLSVSRDFEDFVEKGAIMGLRCVFVFTFRLLKGGFYTCLEI